MDQQLEVKIKLPADIKETMTHPLQEHMLGLDLHNSDKCPPYQGHPEQLVGHWDMPQYTPPISQSYPQMQESHVIELVSSL